MPQDGILISMRSWIPAVAMLLAVALVTPCCVADGPGDNLPGSVRPIPPPGIELDEAVKRRLLDGAAGLARDVAALERASASDRAEVLVFARAVRLAVEDRFLYSEKEVEQAEQLLARGRERLEALGAGASGARLVLSGSAVEKEPRLVAGGLVSRIDGSAQPYGLVLPAGLEPGAGPPRRLDVWLHGRGEKVSEVAFLTQRLATVGEIAPPDTIVLHPYGRYSNAFKFAGEVDVLEAIAHVKTLFPIDEDRIVIRGFSMGGAGCWQLAVHVPGVWLAATPGAGFAETREFLRSFQQQAFQPTAAQAKLLHWFDCPDWANNLRHLPTIAYSGELDKQKQASDIMVAACAARGFEIPHVIGPGTAHKIHPDSKVKIEAFVSQCAEQGRSATPRAIDFTTYTLRYPTHAWLTVTGLEEHWREARVRAAVATPREIEITTTNVTSLAIDIPAGARLVDSAQPVTVRIDGTAIAVPPAAGDRRQAAFVKESSGWRAGSPDDAGTARGQSLRKRPGLQGPIDDAFMDAFVFVGPVPRFEAKSPTERWVADEFARVKREWRRHFRGDIVERLSADVSADDLATKHLVLFGTAESNALVAKILPSLPVKRDGDTWRIGAAHSPAGTSLPLLVYPNPLNPDRYIVWNSGFTFREFAYLNNARQIPMLPDWALVSTVEGRDSQLPGTILAEGFFDEQWQP